MDQKRYQIHSIRIQEDFENICVRCGECCGGSDDPCSNLVKLEEGKFICKSYSTRLGRQSTVKGNIFTCVEIRERIKNDSLPHKCAYRKFDNYLK